MITFGTIPSTDPGNLFRLRDSIYASDLFIVAVAHLNFFSWLEKNPSDIKEICSSLQIKERPADVMITLFKALNLIEEKDNCFYLKTLAKEYLIDSSEFNLIPYISSLKERPICYDLLKILKTGKPASWAAAKDEQEWALAMKENHFAEKFTAGMDSRGAYLAPALFEKIDLLNYHSLLDIAGASGIYAASAVYKNPFITATVLEKPPVDKLAEYSINKRGMSNKIKVIAGDMFKEEFPKGFDVHLFSNVLHDWDSDKVEKLLENSYRNLNSGGQVLIYDAHINSDKNGPLEVAEYSVLLMFSTEGKCYSFSELKMIMEDIGFSDIRFIPMVANRSIIVGKK
jgi:SAM-dependent methyltransferase